MQLDAEASLQYAVHSHTSTCPLKVIIWGQSIGCAFASHLAASIIETPCRSPAEAVEVELETLILETPFTSASEMLKTLYPQRWLPYRYLSVFLWNRLDTVGDLDRIRKASRAGEQTPHVVVLEGGKDELVPQEHGDEIEMMFKQHRKDGAGFKRITVEGALHTQVLSKGGGRRAAADAIGRSSYK